jgi:hypothetical protein
VHLGSFPPGSRVPVRFTVKNRGKKPLDFSVEPLHPAITLTTRWLYLKPSEEVTVQGTIALGQILPGLRAYRVRFGTPMPAEAELVVEVVPRVVRLEFAPPEVVFPNALPGAPARRSVTARNTGNVPVSAALSSSVPWLSGLPARLELAPGALASFTVTAKMRKADSGEHTGAVRADAGGGNTWELPVRVRLPLPELSADAVEFGEVQADRPYYQTVELRNVGVVRVACTLATDQPWLAVAPKQLTLLPGKWSELKLRARIPAERAGGQSASVIVSAAGAELLRVPVSASCRIPKPVLAPVRRRTLGAIANDSPAVRRFRIANTGDGRLDCSVSADQPWVEILTKELKVGAGKKRRVEFRVNTPAMDIGSHLAVVRVRSNGGNVEVPVSVNVVAPEPELEVLGDADLGLLTIDTPATGHLAVRNVGVGLLKLQARPDDARVTVTPAEMTLAPGPPSKLAVAVAVADLDGGSHSYGVRFTSNGGSGQSAVKFRLPIEEIDAPSVIDLGDRAAGRPASETLRVRNTGPNRIALTLRAEHSWLRPETDRVVLKPGELVSVPIRMHLPHGVFGPVTSTVRLEGRKLRHAVAVRAVARKVDLAVVPRAINLGEMRPGAEREVTFDMVNRGEMTADVRDSHTPGDLQVWVRRETVKSGETVTLTARVRMNSRAIGQQVKTVVTLADRVSLEFSATVVRSKIQAILGFVAIVVGLVAGIAIGAATDPGWGATAAIFGVLPGVYLLTRDMT